MTIIEAKEYHLTIVNDDRTVRFVAKKDGCVDITMWCNGADMDNPDNREEDIDYLHVCDLETFIKHLQEVQSQRKLQWPKTYT